MLDLVLFTISYIISCTADHCCDRLDIANIARMYDVFTGTCHLQRSV